MTVDAKGVSTLYVLYVQLANWEMSCFDPSILSLTSPMLRAGVQAEVQNAFCSRLNAKTLQHAQKAFRAS